LLVDFQPRGGAVEGVSGFFNIEIAVALATSRIASALIPAALCLEPLSIGKAERLKTIILALLSHWTNDPFETVGGERFFHLK
jgi:hypothetical protein